MRHRKAVGALLLGLLLISATVGMLRLEVGEAKKTDGKFGAGVAPVVAPAGVTDVAWGLDSGNSALIDSITLKLGGALTGGSRACVQVRDIDSSILADGCTVLPTVLPGGLATGSPIVVFFDSTPSTTASAAAITGVSVTVVEPVDPVVDGPKGVNVTDVAWDLAAEDTTLVDNVTVTLAGIKTGKALKVHMTLKDAAGDKLQRVTGLPVVPSLPDGTGTVTWDLTTEGDPVGPVSAEAITRFEIEVTPDK